MFINTGLLYSVVVYVGSCSQCTRNKTQTMVQVEDATLTAAALTISFEHGLPVGAGFRAIRSPRSEGRAPQLLVNQDSTGSGLSRKVMLTPSGSSDSLDAPQLLEAHQAKEDLAKRAQNRVAERKRTEFERKQELEKQRLKKQESDKIKKEHDQQLRQRRRAEIYALNAILRQLQQEKMAAFVNAHKTKSVDPSQQTRVLAAECSEVSLVESIGV